MNAVTLTYFAQVLGYVGLVVGLLVLLERKTR